MDFLLPALRRGATLTLLSLLALVLAACGAAGGDTGDGGDGGTDGGATATVTDGVAEVSADDMAFDVDTIETPSGEAFTIRFTNNEDGVPHNLSVYAEEGGDVIAQGEVVNAGETDDVEIAGLEAGEYFFVCDLHPDMTGTVVVGG